MISLWSGRRTGLPSYEKCSSTVDAEGTTKQRLTKKAVLCVRISAGFIARLKLTEFDSDGILGDDRATFDAVLWRAS
ncbi:hypothetical protein ACIG54_00530 [Streptomyces achromogenes]|uniref:hypothetical protein n=1 Tax=Streptomyces achromogenes TaxID=67255 RepID=UPI0037D93DAC